MRSVTAGQVSLPALALAFVLLFALTQLPLYAVRYPDIIDLPNHVARMHVLTHWAESASLQRYYSVDRSLISPNLAMEVLVPPIAEVLGPDLAVRLFASAATLALTSGVVALAYALSGRLSYLPLGGLIFANNALLISGFLNFVLGLGLALWLLAAWIRCPDPARPRAAGAFAAAATLLYLCHLSAFGVYALGAVSWQLRRARAARQLPAGPGRGVLLPTAMAFAQFLPAALIHLAVARPTAGANWVDPVLGAGWTARVVYKLVLPLFVPASGLPTYPPWQSLLAVLLCVVLIGALLRETVRFQAACLWIAIPIALAILLLPPSGFGSNNLDTRLLPVLLLILWAGLEAASATRRARALTLALVSAGVVLSSAVTFGEWRQRDPDYAALRAALDELPPGARVATVAPHPSGGKFFLTPNFAAWGVIDRGFLLSSFYLAPFQPFWVAFRPEEIAVARLARLDDLRQRPPDYRDLQSSFDYVVFFGSTVDGATRPSPQARTVYETPFVRIVATDAAPGAAR